MRLHRFYSSEIVGNRTELTITDRELVHQLRHVFRLRAGDSIIIFDGSGSEYTCVIASYVGDDRAVIDVRESARARFTPGLARKILLFTAIVKKDNFETVVEKATELGVTDIIPVLAERSEKKSLNEERLKKIAMEASEQSGRGDVPAIHPIVSLKEAIEQVRAGECEAVAFHTDGAAFCRGEFAGKDKPLGVFIGPEGGWSPGEVAMFHENKIAVRCLGPQVLRAETAAIATLSMLIFD